MSSVTGSDPTPEGDRVAAARRARGRGGRPWRRKQADETPMVVELDGDEVEAIIRRSFEAERATSDLEDDGEVEDSRPPFDDLDEETPRDEDLVNWVAARQPRPTVEDPEDPDADWGRLLDPGTSIDFTDDEDTASARHMTEGHRDDEADEVVLSRLVGHDDPDPATGESEPTIEAGEATDTPRPESRAIEALIVSAITAPEEPEPTTPDVDDSEFEATAFIPVEPAEAEHAIVPLEKAVAEPSDEEPSDEDPSDEDPFNDEPSDEEPSEADAAAAWAALATGEPGGDPAPGDIPDVETRAPADAASDAEDDAAAQRVIAQAIDMGFAEPLPATAPRRLWPRRRDMPRPTGPSSQPLRHSAGPVDAARTEAVAEQAARLRRDAELAAAEQAAERIAAEEAAERAAQARAEADRLAREQAETAAEAHRALLEAEAIALRAAQAREVAEQAARERAALADAETARREDAERLAEEQAMRAAAAYAEREAAEELARRHAGLAAEAATAREQAEALAEEYAEFARVAHEERAASEERARALAEAAADAAAEHAEFARRMLEEREAAERSSAEIAAAREAAEEAARQQAALAQQAHLAAEAAEERARSLAEQAAASAEEHGALARQAVEERAAAEQAAAEHARLAQQAHEERIRAEYAAQEQAELARLALETSEAAERRAAEANQARAEAEDRAREAVTNLQAAAAAQQEAMTAVQAELLAVQREALEHARARADAEREAATQAAARAEAEARSAELARQMADAQAERARLAQAEGFAAPDAPVAPEAPTAFAAPAALDAAPDVEVASVHDVSPEETEIPAEPEVEPVAIDVVGAAETEAEVVDAEAEAETVDAETDLELPSAAETRAAAEDLVDRWAQAWSPRRPDSAVAEPALPEAPAAFDETVEPDASDDELPDDPAAADTSTAPVGVSSADSLLDRWHASLSDDEEPIDLEPFRSAARAPISQVEVGVPTAGDLAALYEGPEDDELGAVPEDESAAAVATQDVVEPKGEVEAAPDVESADALADAELDQDALDEASFEQAPDETDEQPEDEAVVDEVAATLSATALDEPESAEQEPEDLAVEEEAGAQAEDEDFFAPEDAEDFVSEEELETEPVDEVEPVEEVEEAAPAARVAGSPATAVKHTPYHSKRGTDALAPLAILVALACAAVVGRMALMNTLRDDIPLAGTLTGVAFVLLLYALRSSNSARTVHIDEHGVLKVTRGDMNSRFDLTSPSTQLEMVGTPGHRNWRLLIIRRSLSPVVIDSKTVDSRTFTEAVRQWRPEL